MQVLVNFQLLQRLVECIDKQAILDDQDAETQARWKSVISSTYHEASTQIARFKQENLINDGRTETGMGPVISPEKTQFL